MKNIVIPKIMISVLLAVACSGLSQVSLGKEAACDSLGGSVILTDSMYGMLIGGIATGLFIVAADDRDQAERKVALGALSGLTIGAGFGIFESVSKDCTSPSPIVSKVKPGFQAPRLLPSGALAFKQGNTLRSKTTGLEISLPYNF